MDEKKETKKSRARMVRLVGEKCTLRPWLYGDEDSLTESANNPHIHRAVRDIFPSPYTRHDAEEWIRYCALHFGPPRDMAIECEGRAVGGMGMTVQTGFMQGSAEVGYWLAESHWNRGIATEALMLFSDYAVESFRVHRLYAYTFTWNTASYRVLEKAGYEREGTLRSAAIKGGEPIDLYLYAKLYPFKAKFQDQAD